VPPALILEDGSGVVGANSLVTLQEVARFHSETGGLTPIHDVSSSAVTFAAGGILTAPAGTFASIPEASIVEIYETTGDDLGPPANRGFAFVQAVATPGGDQLTLAWLSTVTEAPGASLGIVVYDKAGWWAPTAARLVSSVINATRFVCKRYGWAGWPTRDVQALAWPRRFIRVGPGSPYLSQFHSVQDNEIPLGVKRAICWLTAEDISEPLEATEDLREALVSKSVTTSGISKVFGGPMRRRRYPQADSEVAGLTGTSSAPAGPFIPLESV
jgi:hypothetical protein